MPAPTPRDWRQHLEVETPEHVVLDYELAGLGSRALAAGIDTLILLALALAVTLIFGVAAPLVGLRLPVVLIVLQFALAWGYFTFFEAFAQGRTPGKKRMGIRVVHDTGQGVTFTGAALRNLLRPVDALPPPYFLGAVLVAVHPRAKRLGDMVAGTVVVRDRPEAASAPAAAPVSATADRLPELADQEYALLRGFRERAPALPEATRARLAAQVAERFSARYPARPRGDQAFLVWLFAEETARRRGRLGARGPSAGERFSARREPVWREFEVLAAKAARRGLDAFEARELVGFAARYREVAADLARARTYGADRRTLERLERVVAAGHNVLYRREHATGARVWTFLFRECPAAVVAARRFVLLAFLTFAIPAVVGYLVLREQPGLGAEVLPDVLLERAQAGAERQREGLGYFEAPPGERPTVASSIVTNNLGVAISCFAGGALAGVGSLALLGFNGLVIGAASGHFANYGLLGYLWTFVAGHGVLELFAIWVAGAAGFLIGRAVWMPGDLSRADALVLSGRTGLRLVVAAGLMLVVAGLIEGFISASGLPLQVRIGASVASAVFLVVYLAWGAWPGGAGVATRGARGVP